MPNGTQSAWTDQQWSLVQQTIYEEARKARVAAKFLPLYGPLSADAETVPKERLNNNDLTVNEKEVLHLVTLYQTIKLSSQQVAQPDLSAALSVFRRAANKIARAEDTLIFNGLHGEKGVALLCRFSGYIEKDGLLSVATQVEKPVGTGEGLISAVAAGIGMLESSGYGPPFALVLSTDLFSEAEKPGLGLVLPSDRIRPLIEGPLVRTGTLQGKIGILLSLAGQPVEIVVASDISATFLQVTDENKSVFRVSERFVLRVKETGAVVRLGKDAAADEDAAAAT